MKAEVGWKLGLLCQTVSQAVNPEEKFLKETWNAIPVNIQMVRKLNCGLGESFSCLDRRSNQLQHSLKSKLNPEQDPNSLQCCEGYKRKVKS